VTCIVLTGLQPSGYKLDYNAGSELKSSPAYGTPAYGSQVILTIHSWNYWVISIWSNLSGSL